MPTDYAEEKIAIGASFIETYQAEFIEVDDDLQKAMDKVGALLNHKKALGG